MTPARRAAQMKGSFEMKGEGFMNEPRLTVSVEEAKVRIQQQIEQGQDLCTTEVPCKILQNVKDSQNVRDFRNVCVRWSNYNERLLDKLLRDRLDYISFDPTIRNAFEGIMVMRDSIGSLEGILEVLDLYEEDSEPTSTTQHSFGNDVFIVHGRDDGAKDSVARVVRENLELEPIILQEQPDKGDTVIEKLERCSSNVGYAIALVTSDDIGALKDKEDDELNARARQNVVFELGYFMGKLCRERVCLLLKDKVELPSDLGGIVYIYMDPNDGWKARLQLNIRAVIQEVPNE